MNEDLRTWFRQKWVRMDTKGEIKGPCAREDGEGKPKCLPAAKARSMDKKDRATAARRKRREDPVADRKGKGNKPIMVNTEEFIPEGNEPTNPSLWSKAKALAKKKFDVYPSAYANGWAAKYYKSKGGGWRSVSEESVEEACWKGYKRVGMKKKGDRMVPNCVPEAREIIEKAKAKSKKDPLTGAKIDKDRFILPEEQMEEGWVVKKGTEVVSTHKTKDEADVKAMKHPLYKVYAKEETEIEEAFRKSQIELNLGKSKKQFLPRPDTVGGMATKRIHHDEKNDIEVYHGMRGHKSTPHYVFHKDKLVHMTTSRDNAMKHAEKLGKKLAEEKDLPWEEDPKNPSRKVGERKDEYGNKIKNVAKHLAKKAMKANEDVEQIDEYANYRKAGKDPFAQRKQNIAARRMAKTGVKPGSNTSSADAIAAYMAKNPVKKYDTKGNVKEELGKDNEWGRPELRKKYAAMTPGQEGLAADKIPTFDPRYDDVTTQHLGLHPMKEGFLAEISARGAEARAKFQARVHKVLNDPAAIKRAKKTLAKQKAVAKAAEPAHLVMQLRKAVSVGSKVHFRDGSHHTIAPNHADRFMSKYHSAKSAIEKEALQKRAHASHSEFMKSIAEEVLGEVYSVHVKGEDNSPKFKEHIKGWGGEKHYVSDKGVAYKFKHSWQADGFHHGVKTGFRHLDSEHDGKVNEETHENCGTPDCCMQCDTAEMGTHHVDSYEAHKGSGDQISPVISHDDDDIRFQDFDEEAFEKELEADVHALGWEDMVDLYDDDELEYVEDGEEIEDGALEEAITPAGRLKKKFNAMRTKTRRNMARNLALKRVSTPERVKSRSIRAARRMVYKRLLRNRDISTVSAAEKTRLEAQVKRMAPMVARLSVRIMPKVRKLEQSRIQHARMRKK